MLLQNKASQGTAAHAPQAKAVKAKSSNPKDQLGKALVSIQLNSCSDQAVAHGQSNF